MKRIVLAIGVLFALMFAEKLNASTIGPEPDFQWEGSFNYAVVGGTVLEDTCSPDALSKTCPPYQPNAPHDLQGDTVYDWPNLAEMYGVPGDATIEKVFLVWMGSCSPGQPIDNTVTVQPPAGDQYDVTADPVNGCEVIEYQDTINLIDPPYPFKYFICWADITEQMRHHVEVQGRPINGMWSFGHLVVGLDWQFIATTGVLGNWAAIVIYQSPSIARKRIYLYKGFERAQCGQILLNPSGFEVPPNPQAKITFMVGEGDAPLAGSGNCQQGFSETLKFNGTVLADQCNIDGNQYNSTRNTNVSVQPCLYDVFSLDLDTFQVGHLLHEGDTSATVEMQVGQDQIFTAFLMISIDTKLPSFDIPGQPEKTCSVPDGGYVSPGDEFEYYIRIENWGEDIAHQVVVQDDVPEYTEYVCGSTYICGPGAASICDPNNPANWRQIPDVGDCGFPLAGNGYLVADSMPVGADYGYTIKFKVRLLGEEAGVNKETIIYNAAKISSSDQGEVYITNGGIPVRLNVQVRSYEGRLRLERGEHDPRGGFVRGGESNLPIMQIKASVREGDVKLNSIKFDAQGDFNDASGFTALRLYEDTDGDGKATANDTLLDDASFSVDDGTITFSIGKTLRIDETKYFLLVADFADDLTAGTKFKLSIESTRSLDVQGFIDNETLPLESGEFRVPQGNLQVFIGRATPAGRQVNPGETFPALQIGAVALSGSATIDSVHLVNTGNTTDNHFTKVELFLDVNGDGAANGDQSLGVCNFSNKECTFSGLSVPVGTSETNLLFVVSLTSTVPSYRTIKLKVDDLGFAGGETAEGLPLESDEFMVAPQGTTDGDYDTGSDYVDGYDTGTDNGGYSFDEEEPKKSSDEGCATTGGALAALAAVLALVRRTRSRK